MKKVNQQKNSKKRRRVSCKKCKSDRIFGNYRGYSFKNMFIVLLFIFSITIFIGFLFPWLDNIVGIGNLNILGTLTIFVGLPLAVMFGFSGRKKIINGCMDCGHKWIAGKR